MPGDRSSLIITATDRRPVRLLQFSDTHLSGSPALAVRGVATGDTLARCIAHAERQHPEPRAILLTGDLVHDDAGGYAQLCALFADIGAPAVRELLRVSRRMAIVTVWPCADGVVDAEESVRGSTFIRRQYSHEWLCSQIETAAPGQELGLVVVVLDSSCWSYVLKRRAGGRPRLSPDRR